MRVLVIEDTPDIAVGIQEHLRDAGIEARVALTGKHAQELMATWPPSVIILDLMLPDINGYEILRLMRERGDETPVLILSAMTDEVSKMQGFRDGADDYVTKPFSLRELAARVHAMSRRSTRVRTLPASVRFGAVTINPLARTARIGDRDAGLRPKEFELLLMLVSHPGEALSRAQLLSDVWAYEAGVESRTVDWHVAELRRKLQDEAEAPHLIETVRRGGYRWVGGVGAEEVPC